MLDDYIAHIESTKNKSLLVRIYGIFTFHTNKFTDFDVVIMQNTINLRSKDNPCIKFDLKGSSRNRYIKLDTDDH